jgi:hypothetical protein
LIIKWQQTLKKKKGDLMTSRDKLFKIVDEIYTKLFAEATPSIDYELVKKKYAGDKSNWFFKYYLPEKKFTDIIETILKKYKITTYEKNSIRETVYLGHSPTSVYEVWLKNKDKDDNFIK